MCLWYDYLFHLGRLKAVGITCKSSIGSTPSCSHPIKDMAQLSEVHPGNYVFYGVCGCVEFNIMKKYICAVTKTAVVISNGFQMHSSLWLAHAAWRTWLWGFWRGWLDTVLTGTSCWLTVDGLASGAVISLPCVYLYRCTAQHIRHIHVNADHVFSLCFSLDGAGKLPTGFAVIEGHPDLK